MANDELIGTKAFEENLITYYSKSGEINISSRIETLTKSAIMQNNIDNPFFLSEFLNTIKKREIKLEDLVSSNRSS